MLSSRALRFVTAAALLVPAALVYAASFGPVTGSDTAAKTLNPTGGTTQAGVVDATGDLNVSGGTVAIAVTQAAGGSGTATATITNSGKIRQVGTGRAIRNNSGAVAVGITNNAGATISSLGDDAIQVSVSGSTFTLDNSGTISAVSNRAVNLRDAGPNTINNLAGGMLTSSAGDAVRPGTNGIINNYGTISATLPVATPSTADNVDGNDGIQADITGGLPVNNVTVTNFSGGSISGRHGITGSAGTTANFSITLNNNTGATLTGINGSGVNIDSEGTFLGNATVNNDGTILGKFDTASGYTTGDGDGVDVDGILTLVNNGIIRATGAGGNGSDGRPNNPEGVSIGGGTITNNAGAEITGQDTSGTGTKGHGILVDDSSGGDAIAATTITNSGLIRGYDSYAIRFIGTFADTITNNATGVIRGAGNSSEGAAIQTGDGADTINNSGSIISDSNSLAVDLGAGDDIMHVLGSAASISGDISGGAGSNTLDFDPGASNSFSYSGVLSNFSSVEIKTGTVTLSGASTYSGSTQLSAGTLIASNSSGSASGTGLLTIKNGAALRGTGTVGAVSTESGSMIAPGTTVSRGTLTIDGDLTAASGSNLQFALGATSDRLNIAGTFAGSGTITVNIVDAGIVTDKEYTLASFASSSGLSNSTVVLGAVPTGFKGKLQVKSGSLVLYVAGDSGGGAMNFWSMFALGALGLFGLWRNRQSL